MAIKAELRFRGLDTDRDLRKMSPGAYRYALNIRCGSSENSSIGSVQNVRGNTLVSFALPAGTNKCIGTHEDIQGNSAFFFLYNSNAKNGIYRFNAITNSISKIFPADETQPDILKFQENKLITGTAFINNQLSWTDGVNPQRKINVLRAPTYPTPYIEAFIDFVKIPPVYPIIANTVYDNTVLLNTMEDKNFQFIYRYVFVDNEKSVWAPVSKIAVTSWNLTNKLNKITLDLTSGGNNKELTDTGGPGGTNRYAAVIKKIEVAFRDNFANPYRLINSFPFPTTSITFLNDENYPILDVKDTSKIEDAVPPLSDALGAVQGRIFLGNNTEGFDVNVNDITINRKPDVYTDYTNSYVNKTYFKNNSRYNLGIVFYDRAGRRSGVYFKDKLKLNVLNYLGAKFPTMEFEISGTPPEWAETFQVVRTNNLSASFFIQGRVDQFKYVKGYNDNGEPIYCHDYNVEFDNNSNNIDYANEIHIDIKNFASKPLFVPGRRNVVILPDTEQKNIIPYVWTKGDKINFLTINGNTASNDPRQVPVTRIGPFDTNLQGILIKDVRDNGDTLVIDMPKSSDILNKGAWVEIYTPTKPSDNEIFYEVGNVYTIINAGTTDRKFGTELGDKKTIPITEGDVFVFKKYLGLTNAYNRLKYTSIIESMTPRYFGTAEQWEVMGGKPCLILENEFKRNKFSQIRFGGLLVPETQINNTSSFNYDDNKILPVEFGPIYKLQVAANNQSEGTVLLSIHANEIAPIYIGQAVLKQAAGGQVTSTTDQVIGSINPIGKTIGSINPESIKQKDGMVYGWDGLKGIVWRYAQNGLDPISEMGFMDDDGNSTGMRTFFYDKSRELLGGTSKVFGGIDPYNNQYVISMPGSDNESRTLAWNEKSNKWESFYSYLPEFMERVNTYMISFKSGQLWTHSSNSVCNNFYGLQYTSKLQVICNQEEHSMKILQRIEEEGTDCWDCPDIATPEGQSSELIGLRDPLGPYVPPQDFHKSENTFFGAVMRDKNTPNEQYPLLNGDVIRSNIFMVLMECNKTAPIKLHSVNLYYIPSMKTNR